VIIIASSIVGTFLCLSIATTPFFKSRANTYLSISLFLLTCITLLGWNNSDTGIFDFLQDIMWEFLVGAILFTYFLLHIKHNYLQERWYNWLYFPFLFTLSIEILLHLDFSFGVYNSSLEEESFTIQFFYFLESILAIFFNLFLILWARKLIKISTSISKEKKRWLLRLNLFIICIIGLWVFSDIEDYFFDSEFSLEILWVVLSSLSWWILYYGIFRLQIVTQKDEIHSYLTAQKATKSPLQKKKSSSITSAVISQLYNLMEKEEWYKNPLLSRLDLANELEISESYLSKIVNEETNKSTIQFVNEYRIQTAKELLQNSIFDNYSVEAIGMESGFKSKSSFYSTFKKDTGISPGVYRKQQKQS